MNVRFLEPAEEEMFEAAGSMKTRWWGSENGFCMKSSFVWACFWICHISGGELGNFADSHSASSLSRQVGTLDHGEQEGPLN